MPDDMVTLRMTRDDLDWLLFSLGTAAGAMHDPQDLRSFYGVIGLTNRLMAGRPDYQPYAIHTAERDHASEARVARQLAAQLIASAEKLEGKARGWGA